MGRSVSFYCSQGDTAALSAFASSIGLHVVPMRATREGPGAPTQGPFCYLSPVPPAELRPYGPNLNYSDAVHPLIEYLRAYYEPPYLISGRIYWSNDVAPLASVTKPFYERLARWVRSQWRKLEGHSFYFGPEAEALVLRSGAIPRTFAPGLTAEVRMRTRSDA